MTDERPVLSPTGTCQECGCTTGGAIYCYQCAPYTVTPLKDGSFVVDRNGRKRIWFDEPPTPATEASERMVLSPDQEPALARALRRIAKGTRLSSLDVPILEDAADALAAKDADLARVTKERDEWRKDAIYHADCRPNRKQAEAAIADAKAMNDKWADEVKARREAEAEVASLRAQLAEAREHPCVCQINDGLVREWVAKAREVARSKGYTVASTPGAPTQKEKK